jgi:3-hydroxybutyryl-CoA dehydrogenase
MTAPLGSNVPVAVLGAGTMGIGIAQVAAAAGHHVLVHDVAAGAVTRAKRDLGQRLMGSVARGSMTEDAAAGLLDRITGCDALAELAGCGLVVEAIVEDLDAKRATFRLLEQILAPEAILATNTSSLSVTAIAAGLERPGRVVGMHFFNPAPVMPLVEIVSAATTDPAVADLVHATATAWGKTAVRCASTPGFIVNRVARPFYGEALLMLQEGMADPSTIDAAVTGAGGFPMGPFTLMDLVGLDVNLAVSTSVYEQTYHDARFAPSVIQRSLVDAGRLGRKSGRGFYGYGPDDERPAPAAVGSGPVAGPVTVHGDMGWAAGLVGRLRSAGVTVDEGEVTEVAHLRYQDTVLVPTDGRTATELGAVGTLGGAVVVLDLVRDWKTAAGVAVAAAGGAPPSALGAAAGVLGAGGLIAHPVSDRPALVLMRIVAQLASVAADAVMEGVAAAGDVDVAMRLGTGYPAGPLEWGDAIGSAALAAVLDRLHAYYGLERYRVAGAIRQASLTGGPLRTIERGHRL